MRRLYQINKEGFTLYRSSYGPISVFSDEQLGRLFRDIFRWQSGEEVNPEPDIAVALGFICNQFEIDDRKYLEKCEKNRRNIQSRYAGGGTTEYDRIRPNTTATEKEMEKDKEKEVIRIVEKVFSDNRFIPIVSDWLEYKRERRQAYAGRKGVTQFCNKLRELSGNDPEKARRIINTSMAANYAGIFEERPAKNTPSLSFSSSKESRTRIPDTPGGGFKNSL